MVGIERIMDNNYFIKDCKNCEYVKLVSIDKVTIDKMYCGITDYEILDSKLLCEDFKIADCAKLLYRMNDDEVLRIEDDVKGMFDE